MHSRVWLAHLGLAAMLLGGCHDSAVHATAGTPEYERLELRYQGFNGLVTYPELAEDLGYLAPIKLKWIGNTISGPQDIQSVVTGDIDFGGAFNGAIIKLIAAKAQIKAVIGYYGIDEKTWGGFYVSGDSPIRGPRDLIGKKVAVNTMGAHSEFMLREYMKRGGLSEAEIKEVTLVVIPPLNAELALRQHQVDVVTLGGILADKALERGALRLLFSDHALFGNFTAGSVVFTHSSLRTRPKTVRKFVEATARAIEWVRSQPQEVVRARYVQILEARKRGEDVALVNYWKSGSIAQPGGVIADRDMQMWIDFMEKDGSLSPKQVLLSDLFTNEFNPYHDRRRQPEEH